MIRPITAEFDLVFLDAIQFPLIQDAPPLQLVEIPTAPTTTVAATTAPSEKNDFKDGNHDY